MYAIRSYYAVLPDPLLETFDDRPDEAEQVAEGCVDDEQEPEILARGVLSRGILARPLVAAAMI